jgi:hypothetical protein
MTVSTFKATRTFTMDYYTATTPNPDYFRVGQLYTGAVKAEQKAPIHTIDLASTPAEGPPMPANAIIDLAELMGNVTTVLGTAWTFIIARVDDDRANYDYLDATWNVYDAGLPWRTVAGDDAATPAPITVAVPDFVGDGVVTNALAPFAIDALANRGRLLQLRYRITPGDPATHQFAMKCIPAGDSDITRLRVTWRDPVGASIDHPEGVALPGSRPAPPAPAERPATAGGAGSPAPPARPVRTRRPHGS